MQKSSVIVDDLNMSSVVMLNQPLISNCLFTCVNITPLSTNFVLVETYAIYNKKILYSLSEKSPIEVVSCTPIQDCYPEPRPYFSKA